MEFIIGGYAQGKTSFACEHYKIEPEHVADGAVISIEEAGKSLVIKNYHLFLRKAMEQGEDLAALNQTVLTTNPDIILIADEIGCGLVPMEEKEREYRDRVGHLLCEVAKEAEQVYRVFCGIGRRIK